MEKAVFLGFVAVGLLFFGLFSVCKVAKVSAEVYNGIAGGTGVTIGDWDNDGLNEIAFADKSSGNVYVYRGGALLYTYAGFSLPCGVAIGDYDNDGISNEIAIADAGTTGLYARTVSIWKGPPTYAVYYVWGFPTPPCGVAIGDYDNPPDGQNELAISEPGTGTVHMRRDTTPLTSLIGVFNPAGVAIGNWDNDIQNEVLVAETFPPEVSFWIWTGAFWVPDAPPLMGFISPSDVAIGDYNNDGLNEFAVVDNVALSSTVTVFGLPTIGTRTFAEPSQTYYGVAMGDADNDGWVALAYTEPSRSRVVVELLGDLGGGVPPKFWNFDGTINGYDLSLFLQFWHGTGGGSMALADLGGDVPAQFFAFDGQCNGKDLALFLMCYRGLGP